MMPIPHDLPDYVNNDPESPSRKWRAQVFRGRWGWNWVHQCGAKAHAEEFGYLTWPLALKSACEHMRRHG